MGKSLAARVNIDADPFSQHQLHVSRVTELDHHPYGQIDTLLRI